MSEHKTFRDVLKGYVSDRVVGTIQSSSQQRREVVMRVDSPDGDGDRLAGIPTGSATALQRPPTHDDGLRIVSRQAPYLTDAAQVSDDDRDDVHKHVSFGAQFAAEQSSQERWRGVTIPATAPASPDEDTDKSKQRWDHSPLVNHQPQQPQTVTAARRDLSHEIKTAESDRLEPVDFERVRISIEELRKAADRIIRSDAAAAERWLAQLQSATPGVVATVTQQFGAATPSLIQSLTMAITSLAGFVENVLQPHADTPRRLIAEARELLGSASTCEAVGNKFASVIVVDGWDGRAAEAYGGATAIQAFACMEMAGVMKSSAAALQRASRLNQAVFFLVSEQIQMITRQAQMLATMPAPGAAYSRTRWLAAAVTKLQQRCMSLVEEVSQGQMAQELASKIDGLLDKPRILDPLRWPSGLDKAEQQPADTAAHIEPDGQELF